MSLICHRGQSTSSLSTSRLKKTRGLLTDNQSVRYGKDYSREVNLKDAVTLLSDTKHIYNVALGEVNGITKRLEETLTVINGKAKDFIGSRDTVWGCDDLMKAINDILLDEGQFTCLLGGKSSGKSLVIKGLLDDCNHPIIVMNMRLHSGKILEGLKSALGSKSNLRNLLFFRYEEDLTDPEREAEKIIMMMRKFFTACAACVTLRSLFGVIEDLCKNCVTLVLDEADAAFTVTEDTTAAELKEMKELLGLLKILTKESGMVQYSNKHSILFTLYTSIFFIFYFLFYVCYSRTVTI
jgi:hypothetical protein